jgi:alkyl sulfatase BDS1-like metallo-beta-lactamase superfamily hydrolase
MDDGFHASMGFTNVGMADTVDTHQKMTLDGIDLAFELTPGTEAPVEMNVYFPQFRTLCMAHNAADTMNNLLLRAEPWSGMQRLVIRS